MTSAAMKPAKQLASSGGAWPEREIGELSGEKRGEDGERHRIALGIGEAEGEAAQHRAARLHHGRPRGAAPGEEAARAEIGEIEPAEGRKRIEDPGRHQLGADESHQGQARPEQVADEMADEEFGAFAAPLGRADAEEGDDRRVRASAPRWRPRRRHRPAGSASGSWRYRLLLATKVNLARGRGFVAAKLLAPPAAEKCGRAS